MPAELSVSVFPEPPEVVTDPPDRLTAVFAEDAFPLKEVPVTLPLTHKFPAVSNDIRSVSPPVRKYMFPWDRM